MFIAFILFFLGFIALLFLGFLIWYVAYPESRGEFTSQIDSILRPGLTEQEQRENAFLFADEPATTGAKN